MSTNWLIRCFDRLNTFKTVAIALALILAMNGFLLYRQAAVPIASSSMAAPSDIMISTEEPVLDVETPAPDAEVSEEEPEEPAPEGSGVLAPETPVVGSFGEAVDGCNGDREECVLELAVWAEPEASYIGGGEAIDAGDFGPEVFYDEAPALGACEYAEQEYEAIDGPVYTVIVAGQGSFDSERGSECIPAG